MIYTIKKTATLLEIVMEIFKGISRNKAKKIITYSTIKYNNRFVKNISTIVLEKDGKLELIKKQKDDIENRRPTKLNPIAIYYEDNFFIVAIKPVGILTCSIGANTPESFHKMLEKYLSDRHNKKIKLWVVHRIDREVEGLIIFAKSEKIKDKFKDGWSNVIKKYLALCENRPKQDKGIIENWLMDTESQKVIQFENEVEGSKIAKTEYLYLRPVKQYHLLEIKLITGRKNQIRVHLSKIGCPIVGDRKYGADSSFIRQIRLIAYKLSFNHPVKKNIIEIEYKPSVKFFKPAENFNEKYK